MKLFIKIATFVLFLLLIYTRVAMRYQTPLWVDEVEEIKNLISVKHIIFDYLPYIPAGSPGHYLIALALNMIAPGNKFVLGIPGLLGQILVFLFIPKIISRLQIIKSAQISTSSFIARVGIVFDPMLTFQAMEVRPYSILPILWVGSFFLCVRLLNFKFLDGRLFNRIIKLLIYIFEILIIFIWHFYGFIMVSSIFIYMLIKQKYFSIKKLLRFPAFSLIVISAVISLPIWKYFSAGSANYRHPTFELFPDMMQMISSSRGAIKSFFWQNIFYLIFLVIIISSLLVVLFRVKNKILLYDQKITMKSIKLVLFLVIFPILAILTLDLIHPYWFLYRQFSWTLVPFYIASGIIISSFGLKNNKK